MIKGGYFMFYNVLKAKDIVDLGDEKFKREVLMEDNDKNLSVIDIKKMKLLIRIHQFVMLRFMF